MKFGHGRRTAAILVALLLAACPRGTRKTLTPEVPTDGDPEARERFAEARAGFRRDRALDPAEFASIAADFPDDPIAPVARLYAGMAAVEAAQPEVAVTYLRAALSASDDPALIARGELYLGLALAETGASAEALPLLTRRAEAVDDSAEATARVAALARAHADSAAPLAALPWLGRWWPEATPSERAFIVAQAERLVAAADAAAREAAWQVTPRSKLATAVLADAIAAGRAAENPDAAAELRRQGTAARSEFGLPALDLAGGPTEGPPDGVQPRAPNGPIGAILPLTGKSARVGAQAAAGAGLAVSLQRGAALTVRAAESADAAGAAVDALAGLGVWAFVGPIDAALVDAAAARATATGLTMISLSPRPAERTASAQVFHVMHAAEQRAAQLARAAVDAGVANIALLVPDNGYGRAVGGAFRAALEEAGGAVGASETYPADSKSFAALARKLPRDTRAVFVADTADKLELIAPALAAAGLLPRPLGTKKAVGGRPILLLSTAEGLDADYLRDAGRHTVGAWLVPGFAVDDRDPTIGAFARAFSEAFGKPPTAVDAYAFDAANWLLAGAPDADYQGVTGLLRFDARRVRSDLSQVFTVETTDAGTVLRLRQVQR